MQHGFGESEISWTTTGKANIILDNLIEMGKIKPFTLVMSDGMVQEKVGSEERLNYVLLERMLVEEIIPMAEKKYQFGGWEAWQDCPWVLYRQPGRYATILTCSAKSAFSQVL